MNLWMLLSLTSPISLLGGIFIGVKYYKNLDYIFKFILFYLIASLFTDIIYRYLGFFSNLKYNLFMIPVFGFIELFIYSNLYYRGIFRSKSIPLLVFIVILHVLIISELFFIKNLFHLKSFQSFGKIIADASIILYCLLYYWSLFKEKISIQPSLIIFNAASIIYYSINLFIFLCVNFLVNENIKLVIIFWSINLISMVSFYIILTYLIWQNGKTQSISR